MFTLGLSLYLSNGFESCKTQLVHAHELGLSYVFSSLHIPEEQSLSQDAHFSQKLKDLFLLAQDLKLRLIVDIDPETLHQLGLPAELPAEELALVLRDLGLKSVRLDYGFDLEDVCILQQHLELVCNASTLTAHELDQMKSAGIRLSELIACHNYYPKPYTGLSRESFSRKNELLSSYGLRIMAFIPGDQQLRGPLMCGLPTLEEHRGRTGTGLITAAFELTELGAEIVCVGDPFVSAQTSELLQACVLPSLRHGVFKLACEPSAALKRILGDRSAELEPARLLQFLSAPFHDRPDSSAWMIRSQESRALWHQLDADYREKLIEQLSLCDSAEQGTEQLSCGERAWKAGDLRLSGPGLGRYEGELEILLRDLPSQSAVSSAPEAHVRGAQAANTRPVLSAGMATSGPDYLYLGSLCQDQLQILTAALAYLRRQPAHTVVFSVVF